MKAKLVAENLESINENLNILTIKDLAEMSARTQDPSMQEIAEEVLLKMYLKALRRDGDEGVINLFKEHTKIDLDTIRKGRYYII